MNEQIEWIILITVTVVLSFLLGFYLQHLRKRAVIDILKEKIARLNETLNEMQALYKNEAQEREGLAISLARREADLEHQKNKYQDHVSEVDKLQEKFTKDFQLLANKILEEKSERFTQQNKENIGNLLNPLQEKIRHFEKKVEDTHRQSIDYHAALRQQISGLRELNQQMSKETLNLTRALKGDSKMQGNWGELVLERVLEKSGLEKGREYLVQQSFTNENGNRLIPDVIINLPDGKKMVVDSKVSLSAYERYVNCEDERKEEFLKEHLTSLQRHIDQLSAKRYESLYEIESPDFVLMFVPIEPAFAVAVNTHAGIYNKAFSKNIIIVTPTTLLATLRTIDTMWVNKKQQDNAVEIARQAGNLYDKFQGLITDLTMVGKRMDAAKAGYSDAMNKLVRGKGNLVNRVQRLKQMGAKTQKSLPDAILQESAGDKES